MFSSLALTGQSVPRLFRLGLWLALVSWLNACSTATVDETRDWPADRLYYAARAEMADKKYEKAIDYYQKLDSRYPYGPLAQQGKIDIAFAHWKNEDPASALAACDRFVREHPNHLNIDYVYYLKGRINFSEDLGFIGKFFRQDPTERDPLAAQEAFAAFKILVTRFPDSKYAPDARARMTYLVNALASHETKVAEYYFRRGAYVAAVNRAQEILTTYPQTPSVERALAIIVASYDRMGLEDLRADAERTLRSNFPDSNIVIRDKIPRWWQFW
jgi:outer membrane protein assembly factor BamD